MHGLGDYRSLTIHYKGRFIAVNYLELTLKERQVQHALGTAIWSMSIYGKWSQRIRIAAPNPTAAVKIVEQLYGKHGLIVYQVDEKLTND